MSPVVATVILVALAVGVAAALAALTVNRSSSSNNEVIELDGGKYAVPMSKAFYEANATSTINASKTVVSVKQCSWLRGDYESELYCTAPEKLVERKVFNNTVGLQFPSKVFEQGIEAIEEYKLQGYETVSITADNGRHYVLMEKD